MRMRTGTTLARVFLLSFLGLVAAFADEPKQPSYNGKTLLQWLKVYEEAPTEEVEKSAATAVKAMGTNALPCLLAWMNDTSGDHYLRAPNGFKLLGEMGSPAIPALDKMLQSTNELHGTLAGSSLGYIGKPALNVLLSGLTNRNFRIATDASLAITDLGTNAKPAIPIFLEHLQHTNRFYRERAADRLGVLHIEADVVVPALAKLLRDTSRAARFQALNALGEFGPDARAAVKEIEPLTKTADEDLRSAAQNALSKIRADDSTGTK